MKNNTPPTSESAAPLILKLMLIGGGILVMVLLVFTVRSIIGILRPSPSPLAAMQTNAETVVVHPKPSEGIPLSSPPDNFGAQRSPNLSPPGTQPLSVPDNSQTALSSSSWPAAFAGPNEITKQRKQARIASSETFQRELELAKQNKIVEQRKQARIASLEALQRHLELNAPPEIREQREKQRKAIIEAAKQELLEQAGTSGVPKEALQKLEQSDPIFY